MKHCSLTGSLIAALIVAMIAGACSTPAAPTDPPPSQQAKQAPWLPTELQLRAWQAQQVGTNLLASLEGLVELEHRIATASPNGYSKQAIRFRQQQAIRWTEQLAKVAQALPTTTGQFVADLSTYVLANANLMAGPATLAQGFAPLQMRGRIAFCDGFVAAEPADDVFLKSWVRSNWITDLYSHNPHGVPQYLLFAGLWEAREQWLHELETKPYDEFRHAWGHLVSDLLHNPITRDSRLYQTFEMVTRLRRHHLSKFRDPAPLTDEFAELLVAIQALATSDEPRTSEYGRDAWWNAKRGIDLVWSRSAEPIRRALLGGLRDACLEACQSLSPSALRRRVAAGAIASAKHWQRIVGIAEQFERTSNAPFLTRLRCFEQLLQHTYRFGASYKAVLYHLAKPLRRQLRQEAHDLQKDGCTALAMMRMFEADQLCEVETLLPMEALPPIDLTTNDLPRIDAYSTDHNMHRLYLETRALRASKLTSHFAIRLGGASRGPTMTGIEASLQDELLQPRERAARRWLLGLAANPLQRLTQRAMQPGILAQMVQNLDDAGAAAELVQAQLRWRRESSMAAELPANFHVARLRPAWIVYLMIYGHRAMHELLLQPLFQHNPEALRLIVAAIPETLRAPLQEQLGL
ncbi:MAG: hypothetical protein ACI9SE_002538 [Neolewinella sp.]|jgi:hypothetical protein